ncbi:hypothetical protein M501DRAFT_1018507 [Patellaria atrata CBS 101060]|uniref:Sacsin/Nov domain-containing protein n=1 Tax=Patellaria atrata CBS 101060 TaxID=1346257 RepID=A0A9P4S8F5_9PEZI|nr:hypothetical protein M501DRAFT_1018507 [Patellaria atrata CBS 101060]
MALSTLDLARLRDQTLNSGLDEAVTTNTRALIDKVLARYSGDHTTYRELIQNAADASATKVSIKIETFPSTTVPAPSGSNPSAHLQHVLEHHTLKQAIVSNDGEVFVGSDWARLKRIAEGNPDETKIGAFGVGFYSVFADCEEPFVVSGDKTMAFYWKDNSLFTKAGTVPREHAKRETTFILPYRNTTTPMPDLLSLSQFLCTSLTFVNLQHIELIIDQWTILSLTKVSAPSSDIQLRKDINHITKERTMKITGITQQVTQISAKWMNAVAYTKPSNSMINNPYQAPATNIEDATASLRTFFSRLTVGGKKANNAAKRAAEEAEATQKAIMEDLHGNSGSTVFLRINTVNIQTNFTESFANELERATKKPPPKRTRIQVLTSPYDETAASLSTASGTTSKYASEIFSSILPTKSGKIFIGFPTGQTTGMLCHISAPSVIPTVERESIDLNARFVRTWNMEMLRAAGIACRIAYSEAFIDFKRTLDRPSAPNGQTTIESKVEAVCPSAVHTLRQFTAHESTPSSKVGEIIEEAFWESNTSCSMDILSSYGILPSTQVRVVTEKLSFLEGVPVIPEALTSGAGDFIRKLYNYGFISDMSIEDIKKGLSRKALTEEELIELLKWAVKKISSGDLDITVIQSLFDVTVASVQEDEATTDTQPTPTTTSSKVIVLSTIKFFINIAKIPANLPIPEQVIPFKITKGLSRAELLSLGWEELQIVPWLRSLTERSRISGYSPNELTSSPEFASRVLAIISKQWESLSQSSKASVVEILSPLTVMPTKMGLYKPSDSYFPSVKLFDDLPVVVLPAVKDKFLGALGVRKVVEVSVIFDRLMAQSAPDGKEPAVKWSHIELIKYLVTIKDDIPAKDIGRLKETPFCQARGEAESSQLFKVSQLYEPTEDNIQLGVRTLQWPLPYRSTSVEGKFLSRLGLLPYPKVSVLVEMLQNCAKRKDIDGYRKVIQYWRSHWYSSHYATTDLSVIKTWRFLPSESEPWTVLKAPSELCSNPRASVFSFAVLAQAYQDDATLFGVPKDPPILSIVARLVEQPFHDHSQAAAAFSYMATRLPEIDQKQQERISTAFFVPVTMKNDSSDRAYKHISPNMCFLGSSSTYGDILDFVDFGKDANAFLLTHGAKLEPGVKDLMQIITQQPEQVLGTLGRDKYQTLLFKLAEGGSGVKNDGRAGKELWKRMKQAPCLLAFQIEKGKSSKINSADVEDDQFADYEEDDTRLWYLKRASEITIQDSIELYGPFREHLFIAPTSDELEAFYADIGATSLSSQVLFQHNTGQPLNDQSEAQRLQKHIIERTRLFLYEFPREAIARDHRWLAQNMNVTMVRSILIRYVLKGTNAHFKKSASALMNSMTLSITKDYDWYDISKELAPILIKRPKQRDTLALETILTSDLRRLQRKGYNVDRILRLKEHEHRLAEREQQRVRETEKVRAEKAEMERAQHQISAPPTPERDVQQVMHTPISDRKTGIENMPGGFGPDSPEPMPNTRQRRGSTIFSKLSKRLGLDSHENISEGTQELKRRPESPVNVVDNYSAHHENLQTAIQACRSYNSPDHHSKPWKKQVEEARGTYCDSAAGQNIQQVTTTESGIKVFLALHLLPLQDAHIAAYQSALNTFSKLLLDIGSLFDLPTKTLHIFYNDRGSTIAFNSGGALFFNFHYFVTQHVQAFEGTMGRKEKRQEALAYWYMNFCHELAHNLIKDHGPKHSFYAEHFAQAYFNRVMARAGQY